MKNNQNNKFLTLLKNIFIYQPNKAPKPFILAESADEYPDEISSDINANMAFLQKQVNIPENADCIIRQFKIADKIDAFIFFLLFLATSYGLKIWFDLWETKYRSAKSLKSSYCYEKTY